MLVPHVGGFEGIGLRFHLEDQVDDVFERQVMRVRPVPTAPGQVVRWPVSATHAVTAAHGNVAASSKERWLGICTSASSLNTAYSASIPSRLAPSRSVR